MVAAGSLRIVFFGTPSFARPILEGLLASRHTVVGVVTQPDRPRGRGQRTGDAPVKAVATAVGLQVLQPERLKDAEFLGRLTALRAELGVVAAYGRILTDEVLGIPRLGMINVHASLLPRYRGAAPVHRAVIAGEAETGVTIMRLVKELDAGPMLAKAVRPIDPNETSEQVEHDLARIGARLLVSTIDALSRGPVQETPQDDTQATYAHRLTKNDGLIDWQLAAERIHNLVRGLHPWPHAYAFLGRRRFILLASTWSGDAVPDDPPGTIIDASGNQLAVATGCGTLHIVEIQPEGKRAMGVREFLAGHRLERGDRFGAP